MRVTKLEIDLDKFNNNIKKIKEYTNKELMPVIKANAYGTYINKRLDIINQFNIVAVALVDEGIQLRKDGYKNEIFILNQPSKEEIENIEQYRLTIGLSSKEFLEEIINKNITIHLEIETGMNRTGIKIDELDYFLNRIANSKLKIDGIYSHFSSADFDDDYTKKQIDIFEKSIKIINSHNINPKYIHISASNGILNYKIDITNIVRPGIIMYGYEPFKGANKVIDIEPIATYKTKIPYIKNSHKGEKIGYSQKYTCDKDMIIATIPIGYADGYRRDLSNKGEVLVNNKKCRILGNICMDSCMIDITEANAQVGDEVILFDNKNILLDEIADICDTINYEILCTISNRVQRIFKGGNNETN